MSSLKQSFDLPKGILHDISGQDAQKPHLRHGNGFLDYSVFFLFIPNRSLDFGEIARLCQAACFSPSRRRSGLRRGVARNRMRTEAGKMPESLIFLTENSPGVSNDRFGIMKRNRKRNDKESIVRWRIEDK